MSYTALYRKFRPKSFDEVRGQDAVVTTLKNQIRSGRIGHAYLFCGTRGTGKTSVAKIMARAVNCEHPTENGPCNECETCRSILNGTSTNVIEIDAASNNGVDNIREIREEVSYRPTSGKYKVYIIDEVHMLSAGAFNALLKTLEEPPEYVIFILATTEANRIPVTILSRCQRYDFRRISVDVIAEHIRALLDQEHVKAEDKAVRYIARKADGSMRDALSLLDQCIAFYLGEELTFDKVLNVLGSVDTDVFSALLRRIIEGDASGSIRILEDLIRSGKELTQFAADFTWYLRNLMLLKSSDDLEDILDVSTENLRQLREESGMIDDDTLMRYIREFSDLSNQLRLATQKRVLTETAIIRLCRPQMETDTEDILDRLRQLEKRIGDSEVVTTDSLQAMIRNGTLSAGAAGGAGNGFAPEGSAPVGSASSGFASSGFAPADRSGSRPEPKKPAPEDLKKVRASWKQIIGSTSGILRPILSHAVPRYDPSVDESKLFLYFNDNTLKDCFGAENQKVLRDVILQTTGVDVPIGVVFAGENRSRDLSDIPIDEILRDKVNMPVEEDEDED
jgi:DNA polymerase-3 subunit gamma/tau